MEVDADIEPLRFRSRSTVSAMIDVGEASSDDLDRLVALELQLFVEDAGRHDTFVDLTWPERHGREDFERLLADEESVVLVATDGADAVGHLVGYTQHASATRHDVRYGVLRSMYVEAAHRRRGVGRLLTRRFLSWARGQGCVEAHVNSYTANQPAQDLYEREGFEARSLQRVLDLSTYR